MPLEIVTIPCLSDNYAYLLHCTDTGETALVDAPDPAPILAVLRSRGWSLDKILITHHDFDHIDGVDAIRAATGAYVLGGADDVARLPTLDTALSHGDTITVGSYSADVIRVDGHTLGHIAFVFKSAKAAFTADSLMVMGCGRLFEGTPAMMWDSLQQFAALPDDMSIYSGHEYTASNAAFAQTIEPDNADLQARIQQIATTRAQGGYTVPATLGLERATNPFLRAHLSTVKQSLNMPNASDLEAFTELRARKDSF